MLGKPKLKPQRSDPNLKQQTTLLNGNENGGNNLESISSQELQEDEEDDDYFSVNWFFQKQIISNCT